MRSLALVATATLLGAAVSRLTAQTVVPFDLSHVTVAFYQGDGTPDTVWAAHDYSLISSLNSPVDQAVSISAGPGCSFIRSTTMARTCFSTARWAR